jgi:hypothetical protein
MEGLLPTMASVEHRTRAERSGFVPKCAGRGLWAVVLVLLAGCLNPMPDDFPSDRANGESPNHAGGGTSGSPVGSAGTGAAIDEGAHPPDNLVPSGEGAGVADAGVEGADAGPGAADAGADADIDSGSGSVP